MMKNFGVGFPNQKENRMIIDGTETNEEKERYFREAERIVKTRQLAAKYDYEHWPKTGDLRLKAENASH